MKNIALIGHGYWGKNLARVFNELGALRIICDTNTGSFKVLKEKYPDVVFKSDIVSVLKDKNIKAVVISTPAVTHYEIAKKALMSNKHVFVEKPLALNVKEAEDLVELASKRKKVLMIGHILQYHPALIKLKELISSGELGRVEYIYSNRLNIGKLRREENILWSFAPHDISAILMLLGEEPVNVRSFGGSYLQENIYDTSMTTFYFKSRVKAHIYVSWLHPFKEQKLVVIGNKKMAVFDDMSQEKLFIYPHNIEWINSVPIAQKAEREVVSFKMGEPLKAECEHFIDCMNKGKIPRTDGKEGLKVLKILSIAEESLKRGGKGVHMSSKDKKDYYVHDSSILDEGVKVGKGTQIWHFSHVLKGSSIGKDCKIGQNVVIGPDVKVGNKCKIQNNVSLYTGVTLEDEVFCGPSCVFTNVMNPRSGIPRMKELKKTLVKKGATIGANATIVCGNTLGEYSFIGAGAVVTKKVSPYALLVGNPAKQIGWMCSCGARLDKGKDKISCKSCGTKYAISGNRIKRVKK